MPVQEDAHMQAWFCQGPWIDCCTCATPEQAAEPTCSQGSVSRIDYVCATPSAYDLVSNYSVQKHAFFPTHSSVSVDLRLPLPSPLRRTLRPVAHPPHLDKPNSPEEVITPCVPSAFQKALQTADLTTAFSLWSKIAEDTLFQVAQLQGHQQTRSTTRRGTVVYQEVRAHPKVVQSQASTVADRKVFKAINRVKEVLAASPGYRRDRT